MQRSLAKYLALSAGALLAATACTPSPQDSGGSEGTGEATENIVVAWVNGSPITEDDVTRSIVSTFGPGAYANLTDEVRKTVIESLVMSRAVAQLAEREIQADDLAALEAEVKSFRERELVKFYLKQHARPQPVTEEMIRAYYQEHPELFGGTTSRIFEMIAGASGVSEQNRARVLDALGAAGRREDWSQYAERLRAAGMGVRYSRGELKERLLDARLIAAAAQLGVGEHSPITFVDGVPYVLRIVSEQVRPPRPLQEVRADIRKALLPVQLKQAIEGLSDEVMADVEVRYAADQVQ